MSRARTTQIGVSLTTRSWVVPLEWLYHTTAAMRETEMQKYLQRHLHSHQSVTAKEKAHVHQSVRSLLGSANEEILKLAEDVYHGQYQVVPSILPCQCYGQLRGDLHRELCQWMMRASLHNTTGSDQSLSRGRVWTWACSQSQAQSPLAETS